MDRVQVYFVMSETKQGGAKPPKNNALEGILVSSNKKISPPTPIPTPKGEPELIPSKKLPPLNKDTLPGIGDKDIEQPIDTPEVPADDIRPGRGQVDVDIDTTTPFAPGAGGEVGSDKH